MERLPAIKSIPFNTKNSIYFSRVHNLSGCIFLDYNLLIKQSGVRHTLCKVRKRFGVYIKNLSSFLQLAIFLTADYFATKMLKTYCYLVLMIKFCLFEV